MPPKEDSSHPGQDVRQGEGFESSFPRTGTPFRGWPELGCKRVVPGTYDLQQEQHVPMRAQHGTPSRYAERSLPPSAGISAVKGTCYHSSGSEGGLSCFWDEGRLAFDEGQVNLET